MAFLVRNLVGNSIKFSQQSGKIEISGEETRDGIRFVVRDHGVGMQLNQLDRYGKADSYPSQSGTWGERGTGLGLKLCYEFVSRLEGSIEIGPAEGGGTQATVDLPRI